MCGGLKSDKYYTSVIPVTARSGEAAYRYSRVQSRDGNRTELEPNRTRSYEKAEPNCVGY